jgi:hypothetical protein
VTIVVVGPPAAGKSVVASMLADRFGRSVTRFDDDRARWYGRFGYSEEVADAVYDTGGLRAWHAYTARHDVRALDREVDAANDGVIDTGGGIALQVRESAEEQMLHDALDSADLGVLVCPHLDHVDQAVAVLDRRLAAREPDRARNDWQQPDGAALLREIVLASLALRSNVDLLIDTASGEIHQLRSRPSNVEGSS